jgi:hypothetical protein
MFNQPKTRDSLYSFENPYNNKGDLDKLYTEEDMKKAYEEGCRVSSPFSNQGLSSSEKENWRIWWNRNKK